MVFTMTLHLCFLNVFECFFQKIFYWKLHDSTPDSFPVVKYPWVFFLFLSAVEKAAHKTNHQIFEDPFEYAPKNPVVFILKVSYILLARSVIEPFDIIRIELVEECDSRKHLKSVKSDELKDFFVEDFFIFAF